MFAVRTAIGFSLSLKALLPELAAEAVKAILKALGNFKIAVLNWS